MARLGERNSQEADFMGFVHDTHTSYLSALVQRGKLVFLFIFAHELGKHETLCAHPYNLQLLGICD